MLSAAFEHLPDISSKDGLDITTDVSSAYWHTISDTTSCIRLHEYNNSNSNLEPCAIPCLILTILKYLLQPLDKYDLIRSPVAPLLPYATYVSSRNK